MKLKIQSIIPFLVPCMAAVVTGCNDSFLDRFPEDKISEQNYFKSVSDLETYTNGLYNWSSGYNDNVSDNVIYCEASSVFDKMNGQLTPEEASQWSWSRVRSINFMLARADQASGNAADINHYIGLARLYRAREYYSKVQSYSDVPWYSRDLQTTDEELLYKTQDPRTLVVDSIMADLDFAVTHMKDGNSKTQIYKVVALAEQARIALNEGTFRKYHPELQLNDADRFLQVAVTATEAIMNNYSYDISNSGGAMSPYRALFSSQDLSTNKEIILYDDYDQNLERTFSILPLFNYNNSMSRDFMEDYLYIKDGKAVPFQTVDGYETMTVTEVAQNRDPRMAETIMPIGWTVSWESMPKQQRMEFGGYPQVKFCLDTPKDMWAWGTAYTDLPIIRYAYILLMNAEAKAELGILTQEDVDKTINKIRAREGVNMPAADLSQWLASPDPVQMARYSNIKSTQAGAVAEIRRERRIELACEGYRYNDLMRWGCGKLLEKAPEGAYIPGWGYYDTNGDGIKDTGFFPDNASADAARASLTDDDLRNISTLIVDGKSPIMLSEGDHGHILRVSQVNAHWKWEEPKYYYYPISVKDMNVNPNLVQNKFWAQ